VDNAGGGSGGGETFGHSGDDFGGDGICGGSVVVIDNSNAWVWLLDNTKDGPTIFTLVCCFCMQYVMTSWCTMFLND